MAYRLKSLNTRSVLAVESIFDFMSFSLAPDVLLNSFLLISRNNCIKISSCKSTLEMPCCASITNCSKKSCTAVNNSIGVVELWITLRCGIDDESRAAALGKINIDSQMLWSALLIAIAQSVLFWLRGAFAPFMVPWSSGLVSSFVSYSRRF